MGPQPWQTRRPSSTSGRTSPSSSSGTSFLHRPPTSTRICSREYHAFRCSADCRAYTSRSRSGTLSSPLYDSYEPCDGTTTIATASAAATARDVRGGSCGTSRGTITRTDSGDALDVTAPTTAAASTTAPTTASAPSSPAAALARHAGAAKGRFRV